MKSLAFSLLLVFLVQAAPLAETKRATENHITAEKLLERGSAMRERKDFSMARELLQKGHTIAQNHQFLFELAINELWAGNLTQSLHFIEKYLEVSPNHNEAKTIRARLLGWTGKTSPAERLFKIVLNDAPDNVNALNGLAQLHHAQLHLSLAKNYYQAALRIDLENQEAKDGLRALGSTKLTKSHFSIGHVSTQGESDNLAIQMGLQRRINARSTLGFRAENLSNRPDAGGFSRDTNQIQLWGHYSFNNRFELTPTIGWRATDSMNYLTTTTILTSKLTQKVNLIAGLGFDLNQQKQLGQLRSQFNLQIVHDQSWCLGGVYLNRGTNGNELIGSALCRLTLTRSIGLGPNVSMGKIGPVSSSQIGMTAHYMMNASLSFSLSSQQVIRPFSQRRLNAGVEYSW